MPDVDKAVENYNLNEYYDRALNLIVSGRARNAFAISEEMKRLAKCTATIPLGKVVCWLADS